MRVLFLSHYFPPEVNAPASRTFDHCQRWVRAGHDVTVITCVPNCPDGVVYPGYENRLLPQVETIDGIRVVRVWTFLAANAGTGRRIISYLSFMLSATLASIRSPLPDVVVATSPQFFCGWAGVFVSRIKRAPFVLEIRDVWPEGIAAAGGLTERRGLLRLVEALAKRMYRSADHVVAVGKGYRDHILDKVDVRDRISIVTNGVDLDFFAPREPDPDMLEEWGLQGKFVCSYIGTIGMAHALEVVLKAAEILKSKGRRDICFALVGDGASRVELEARAREAGLGEWVVFPGRQPKERIPAILASSDACLIHLRRCALYTTVIPSKIFEAMAMGLIIIMGVEGHAREIVLRAGAGIEMEPESAESLVRAVEILADDPERGAQQGRAAREFVAKHYNRDVLAARLLEILREVAEKRGSGGDTASLDSVRRLAK
jgi:glycosyltransferase involved in cell wall biosynthesis